MSKKEIQSLWKVYSKRCHADKFLNGDMYARRLRCFRKSEDDDGRGDEKEGIVPVRFGIGGVNIELIPRMVRPGEPEKITLGKDARGEFRFDDVDDLSLFCMYAALSSDIQIVSDENGQGYRRQIEFPDRLSKLGRYWVCVLDVPEFFKRVDAAVEREKYKVLDDLVRYYDPEVGPPRDIEWRMQAIFTKRDHLAYQSEYRFAINTGTSGCEAITLRIGNIHDIAVSFDLTGVPPNFP